MVSFETVECQVKIQVSFGLSFIPAVVINIVV